MLKGSNIDCLWVGNLELKDRGEKKISGNFEIFYRKYFFNLNNLK